MGSCFRAAALALLAMVTAVPAVVAAGKSATEIFRVSRDAIVEVRMSDYFGKWFRGTGFFIAPNRIATNYHAVHAAREIVVFDADRKRRFTFVRIVASDADADTAVLEVAERAPRYLRLNSTAEVAVGTPVFVIGNPQGYTASLSQGIVSGIRRRGNSKMYQFTANVSQGSSGGPVLSDMGEVIGIVFGRLPQEAQIGFATPVANLVSLSNGRPRDSAGVAKGRGAPTLSPAVELSALATSDEGSRQSKDVVRIGVPNADSAVATAYVLKEAIERLFEHSVELLPASHDEIFAEIAQGDGLFDIHPDVWLPNHRRFLSGGIRLNKQPYVAVQGLCVPRYVLTRYAVGRLGDLANLRVARLFDVDEDGKGNIWIGPEGWQSTEINRLKARDYNFAPLFTLDTYPEGKLYERLAAAIALRRPFVFHCYGPHWMFRKYDLVQLKEPPHNEQCFHLADGKSGEAWMVESHASCQEPSTRIHVAYSGRIAARYPRLAEFLEHISFRYEDLNEVILNMVGNRAHKSRVARAWVERNRDKLPLRSALGAKR